MKTTNNDSSKESNHMVDIKDWEEVLQNLKKELNPSTYTMWFSHCTFLDSFQNKIVISTPSRFIKEWIEMKYLSRLKSLLVDILPHDGESIEIFFQICPAVSLPQGQGSGSAATHRPVVNGNGSTYEIDEKAAVETHNLEHLMTDFAVAKNASHAIQKVKPLEQTRDNYLKRCKDLGIISDYNLENFVRGTGNSVAAAICEKVAQGDIASAKEYNPVFIYGDVGLGKTHLLHSLANSYLLKDVNCRVCNVSMEDFLNDVVHATRTGNFDSFYDFYRNVDVFLVDDVQFLNSGEKKGVQEQFFNAYNSALKKNVQIIMASDRYPSQLKNIESRLTSRFESGQIVQLSPPDFSHRLAIIDDYCSKNGINLNKEDKNYLADLPMANIRQLIGNLKRIQGRSNLEGVPITRALLMDVVGSAQLRKEMEITISRIQMVVSRYFRIEVKELKGAKRKKAVTRPRHFAMYLCRELTQKSLAEIGSEFGRDHTTVLYSCDKITKEIQDDHLTREEVINLKRQLSGDLGEES